MPKIVDETKTPGLSAVPRHRGVAHRFVSFHHDPSYLSPGAVWGTIAGAVSVIGKSRRNGFVKTVVHETGQVVDLILNDRHSSPSMPGYGDLYKRLPKSLWPSRVKR